MFSGRRKSAVLELRSKQVMKVVDKKTAQITIERIAYEAWQRDASETIRKYVANGGHLNRRPSLFGFLPVPAQVTIFVVGFGTLMYNIGHNLVPEKQTFEAEFKECQDSLKKVSSENDSLRKVVAEMPKDSTPKEGKRGTNYERG